MRAGFRRGRLDKVQQPGAINSYTAALYPPRIYHYYTVPSNISIAGCTTIIGPSIDDGVGDSRGREILPESGGPVVGKTSPPALRDYMGCFVDVNQCIAEARAFDIVESGNEMLNILHYPCLLGVKTDEQAGTCTGVGSQSTSSGATQRIRLWEEVLSLPKELRCYSIVRSRDVTQAMIERLRIRPVKRKRLVKPMRRGAKVFVYSIGEETQDSLKGNKRVRDNDEQKGDGSVQQKRVDDEAREVNGDALCDKYDDEASLSYQVDDDDDDGDLDGPNESGDDYDYF
uniref:Uncharacterized protein TCIL3000_11_6860 n=1 Tax=Trypanosoma congolense (strain IL3000) TaxID=1068625 RepID=G0V0T9_TRYCI|nr:unnamed protein product [Trypanosoma congolense IL3000]